MATTLTPQEALDLLLEGNKRFVEGTSHHPNQDAGRRAELAGGQEPFSTLFGCSDSRLAAEVIFDQGLGDMFVVRTAGHVTEAAVIGSLEYGALSLGTPLIVVLGHDSCGAVTATQKSIATGKLPGGFIHNLIERIIPSALSPDLPKNPTVNDIVREHTRQSADRILEQAPLVRQAVEENKVAVVGLFYHLAEGKVEHVYSTDNVVLPTD